MKPQTPAAPAGLINDVMAPPQTASAEASLAEPPKEATFIEAPVEPPSAAPTPAEPVAELAKKLPTVEAKSTAAVVKTLPTKQKGSESSAKPTFAVAFAVTLFVALAAVALYAYSKSA